MSSLFSQAEQLKRVEENESFWNNPIYQRDILYSIENTKIFDFETSDKIGRIQLGSKPGAIILTNRTTTTAGRLATYHPDTKVAILNFASYKHPGGGYKLGLMAQEESLCHQSPLYRILCSKDECFYKMNRSSLNYGLYENRILYSPNVPFIDHNPDDGKMICFKLYVITAACPNYRAATHHIQSRKISLNDYKNALTQRCNAVLETAAINNIDHIVLGAFGCGVFRNDPYLVANTFASLLTDNYRTNFECVEFAIPKATHNDRNYKAFECVLKEYFHIIEITDF